MPIKDIAYIFVISITALAFILFHIVRLSQSTIDKLLFHYPHQKMEEIRK